MKNIPLTKLQKEIMEEFYNYSPLKVIYNKRERNKLWRLTTARQDINLEEIRKNYE